VPQRTDCSAACGTATMQLRNLMKAKVHYKLESTEPALYYFKPRYGCIDAQQNTRFTVFLLPFDFYHPENRKHEIIVQSMLVEGENEEDLRQLWERSKQAEVLTQNIKCIPWVRGELAMEPNHELVFEGSFDLPFSSSIYLTNPSSDYMRFDIRTSSAYISVFPHEGTIKSRNKKELLVIRKPLQSGDTHTTTDTITLQSAVLLDESWGHDMKDWPAVPKKYATIKCVYNTPKTSFSVPELKPLTNALQDVS
ncbi:unnamed protein product, partial [Dicrocoelium dendriticum]